MRIHLVPAELDSANDVVRYYETTAQARGNFAFSNIAPGRYWLLAIASKSAIDKSPPAAWDANERRKLRQQAESAGKAIELLPCQEIKDYDGLTAR
jgi:hypothetical protein